MDDHCHFLFSQQCAGTEFAVLGDLMKCGLTDTESCLKAVTLVISGGATVSITEPNLRGN